jgi:2,3-bisphosphoglycerate-dependent phosphoglycerate mutase
MAHLTLIRHGETDSNRVHRFQGQMDVPLNATGLLQAERLAERLAGERFDVGVASDLTRTRATAAPLAERLGLTLRRDACWREQHFGVFEGQQVSDILDRQPDLWAQWVRQDADFALPGGGESLRVFHARVWSALDALAVAHVGQRVLVVTHGGVLDMVWRTVRGQSLSSARQCAIPNAGLNRLRWSGPGRVEIEVWADDAHLAGLPPQPSTVSLSVRYGAGTTTA